MADQEMLQIIFDKLQAMDERIQTMDERIQTMDERMQTMDERMQTMDERLQKVEQKTDSLQFTLENETNKQIRIIAEGHLALNRKLNEALELEAEKEMMNLRVTSLESEVEKLKIKVEQIA